MANENGRKNGHHPGGAHAPNGEGLIYDPTVPLGFVTTDAQTAGLTGWDLPPSDEPWRGYEVARQARRDAERAEADAEWAERHGLTGFAAMRRVDAADNRQGSWDWGDFKTWAIIFAMFFGFLIFSAFVYYSPEGRHNQNDGPLSTPSIRVYTCIKEIPGL
jgi:hypothetical protein